MTWVQIFPTFAGIIQATPDKATYLILMNLSVLVLLALLAVFYLAGRRSMRTARLGFPSLIFSLVLLAVCAAIFYFVYFMDLSTITTEFLGNLLYAFARAPIAFGFLYCLVIPVLLSRLLALPMLVLYGVLLRSRSATG